MGTPHVRAAAYCRISKVVNGRGGGVERQHQDCLEIAARHGWTIEEVYTDDDVSASKYSRKPRRDYLRLLGDIEEGRYDAVVIWMEDRLQRQVIELAEFLKVCDAAGLKKIASIGGEFDLSDPDQRTMLYIKAAMAEAEVEKIRTRIRRKRLEMAQAGKENGGGKRAFGVTGAGKNKVSVARARKEQELIREAISRLLAGDSLRGITLDWERRGIKGTVGERIHNRTLRRILISPRIAGLREYNGELYPAAWQPIIEREQWEAVKALLENPERKTQVGAPTRYLLAGLVYCGVCKNRLFGGRRKRASGHHHTVYACKTPPSPKSKGKCVQRNTVPVENLICSALFEAVESPEFFAAFGDDDQKQVTSELYESLARDQGLLDRLEDKVAQELISPEAAKRNRAQIERRMHEARLRLTQLGNGRVRAQVPSNLREVWPDLSLDRRRAILKAVIERIEIFPTGQGRKSFDPNAVKVTWRA